MTSERSIIKSDSQIPPALSPDKAYAPTKTNAHPNQAVNTENHPTQRIPTNFGRYRLLRELGRGGMGTVVLAEDTQLGRQVALKIPFLKQTADERTLKRFEREAKAAASLSHPNLCAVYDFGTFRNLHYLSMAYIEGRPLQMFLEAGKPIPQRTSASVIRKISLALAHAHERGVIHRDLKPSNVMMDPNLGPVVTDFGLARCLDDSADVQLTQDGVAIGTPSYMSPEQLEGDSTLVGPPSDVFSLGLIFFEMLTGQRRFQGKVTSIIGQILTQDPPSLRNLRPEIDPALETICQKMMARNLAQRYTSMTEVAESLRAYMKGELSPPTQTPIARETSSDPEAFFAELAAMDRQAAAAPSTQTDTGRDQTVEALLPTLIISNEDSRSSLVRRKGEAKFNKKLWGSVAAVVVLGLGIFLLRWSTAGNTESNSSSIRQVPPTSNSPSTAEEEPSAGDLQPAGSEWPPGPKLPGIASVEEPQQPEWDFNSIPPKKPAAKSTPTVPATTPPTKPATSPLPSPTTVGETAPPPEALQMAQGKIDFGAIVGKTVSGSTSEKKFNSPRLALAELTKLERRQQDKDQTLEAIKAVVQLNGNQFQFDELKPAQETVLALDEAVREKIPVEEILAELTALKSPPAEVPPISLTPAEAQRLRTEINRIYEGPVQLFLRGLNNGRGVQTQRDVDLAQAFYEQECRKLPKFPKSYSVPKLRVTVGRQGGTGMNAFQTFVGDSKRLNVDSPRTLLIKRVATALNAGTLIPPTGD